MSPQSTTAVLLLAYGGPDSLEDIPDYLLDIRGGRDTPQTLIDDITERYHLIGGRSPLLEITQSVAQKLAADIGLSVYVGMRHWYPYIQDVMAQMVGDGIEHIIAICMAPHYSMLSIAKYRENLEAAIAQHKTDIRVTFIESWHTQADYLEGIRCNVQDTLLRFPEAVRDSVKVVFTAHSLPAFILEKGDPYDHQLRETAGLLAEKLGLSGERWTFSYQSAAQTGMPWLGPQIEDYLVELAEQGETNLVVAPIGFIADHVEVLYDIDIGVQAIAKKQGVRVERPPMLNDSQPLIHALATLIKENQ